MVRAALPYVQTTTPLAAAATYTGPWVRVRLHSVPAGATVIPIYYDRNRIKGAVVADVASAINGFQIQFANRDDQTDSWVAEQATLVANTVYAFNRAITAKWVRIELVNGAVIQATLTLTATLEDD